MDRPIRLLHVYKSFHLFTKGGGVERYIHSLASEQSAIGFRVEVVSRSSDIATYGQQSNPIAYLLSSSNYHELWQKVGEADIIHIHGPRTIFSAIGGFFAIIRKKRLAYTVHCFYSGKNIIQKVSRLLWDQIIERMLVHFSCCTIVLSEYWRNQLRKKRLRTAKCQIVPNGIYASSLASETLVPKRLDGSPSILAVNRLDPVKRMEDLILVLNEPGLESAHGYVVGRGPDEDRLRSIAISLGLAHRVTFLGFQDDASVHVLARGASVFALPSGEEGMPTTFLEMLALGLPVVGSDNPGNEAIANALNWTHIYPVGDVAAMGKEILAVSGTKVSEAVRTRLEAIFDWPKIAQAITQGYELPPNTKASYRA